MAPDTPQHVQREATDLVDGLSIRLEPAPTLRRVMAYVFDLSIITAAIYVVALVFGLMLLFFFASARAISSDGPREAVVALLLIPLLLFLLIVLCFYHGYFILLENKTGQTPGKKVFGLRVVAEDGGKATLGQCILRDVLRYIDCGLLVPGLVCISLSEKRQRLGDLAARTRVVYARRDEESSIALYMSYERYVLLLASQPSGPIPRGFATRFLSHASRKLILGEPTGSDGRPDSAWVADFESAAQLQRPSGIDDQECLRFFAELCNRRLSAAASGAQFI